MPSSSSGTAGALCAYPISDGIRTRLEALIGRPVDVLALSDLRRRGAVEALKRLLGARHETCYVLIEDQANHPIAPALRLIASFTRSRRLMMVDVDGVPAPFGRLSAAGDAARLVAGSIGGALAALRCRFELGRLLRQPPDRRPLRGESRGLYLKTALWFGVKVGGSVGHVAGVANALAARCRRLDLLAVEKPPLIVPAVRFQPVRRAGAFGYPLDLNYYLNQEAFVATACSLSRDEPFDFVYQRLTVADYSGLSVARRLGIPLVLEYNSSEVWVAQHWGRPLLLPRLAMMAEEAMLRHADLVVAVSDVLGHELRARGVAPERVLVHPNCIDPDRFNPDQFDAAEREAVRAVYGIAADALVCGFIGTFGQWHGVTVLADAIAELARSDPGWLRVHRVHFVLIGDGLLMPQVRATLAQPGVAPFATLTGLVDQDRAPAMLAACDILVSPHVPNEDGSRFFGSPTKLFEYMAMARPIVASDLDQIGDVLHPGLRPEMSDAAIARAASDACAVLVAPGDRLDLIRGVRLIVERKDLHATLAANVRRRVLERYTWQRNVDAVMERLRAVSRQTDL